MTSTDDNNKKKENDVILEEDLEREGAFADATAENAELFSPVEISKEDLTQFLSSVTELVKEKEALESQNQELEAKFLRLQADFDNFRKRSRQEKEDIQLLANKQLICSFLPIVDNFQRALADPADCGSFKEGVEMIYRQFMAILNQAGVEEIEALGNPFDPEFHEAVMQAEASDDKKGLVLMEIQKGYTFHGRLLRPSMVQVGV